MSKNHSNPAGQLPFNDRSARTLMNWFDDYGVDYPWNTPEPWAVWVSEVMLQQTTVAAVRPRFERWMERFPTPKALAETSEEEILLEWEGLGYYNRVRNLASAAAEVERRFDGVVPSSSEELRELPGVGDYIAAAVSSFAFEERTAAVDANGRRIAMRLAASEVWDRSLEQSFRQAVERHMPRTSPGKLNAAVMQLGQLVCTPVSPSCKQCPLSLDCKALQAGIQNTIPPRKKKSITAFTTSLALAVRERAILMVRRTEGIGKGLWFFPGAKDINGLDEHWTQIGQLKKRLHTYTRFRETLEPFVYNSVEKILQPNMLAVESSKENPRWIPVPKLVETPMPAAYRRIAEDLTMFLSPDLSGPCLWDEKF